MSTIRLGTASPGSKSTSAETIEHISHIANRAAQAKIDLLLLPEAYIGGYPRGTSFGCVIGNRSDEGREEFARYFEQAIDLGDTVGNGAGAGPKWVSREIGPEGQERGDGSREKLERIASDSGVFIVVGCIEKAGGSLYCSVVYIDPSKGMIGKHRKVMPTGSERLVWAQGCPSTLRAVSTTIRGVRINLASAICWENYMPLLRQTLYAQNVNLYLAPTADNRDAWLSLLRTIGVEGRCFVVSSNMCQRAAEAREGDGQVPHLTRAATASRARRSSTITEEGHEIALPVGTSQQKKRRKSVMDEDGNQIVLCCDEDDTETATAGNVQKQTNGNKVGGQSRNGVAASFISRGGSSIVDPYGEVLAGPQWEDDEGLLYADVDFRECIKGRLDLDAGGSYSRNDSFKFSVQGLDLDPLPY